MKLGHEDVICRTVVRWSSRTNPDFRNFWRPVFKRVLPLFPEMEYRILNVGVTTTRAHVSRADPWRGRDEEVMRLMPDEKRPDFMLAHELSHVILSEKYTDLYALSRLDQNMMVGEHFYLNIKALPQDHRPYLTRLLCDLAAMALREKCPETWFEARVLEVGELLGIAEMKKWDISGRCGRK